MSQYFVDNETWVQTQWGRSNFGDIRRNSRALKLGLCMLNSPGESLPKQTKCWGELKGGYRLFNSAKVTFESAQKMHWKSVSDLSKGSKNTVLFIQDKSEVDFSSKKATKGLGPIGNHKGQGILLQSVLAVEYNKKPHAVFGLAYQKAWIRTESSFRKKETRCQRYKRSTEADYWIDCLKSIDIPDNPEARYVAVGDRENDMYKFISYCNKANWHFLVRANNTRKIITESGESMNLADYARSLEKQTTKEIELRTRAEKPSRKATLSIGWGVMYIPTPKNGFRKHEREVIKVSLIRVWEEDSDELEWFLVTNLAINSTNDALEMVSWYETRWLIEEYHKCLKTGCAIEKSQLRTAEGLLAHLGFLGVIATRLLAMKFFTNQNPSEKAKEHYPLLGVQLLCSQYNLSVEEMTCYEFWRSIARLGGFLGRKSDGEPGWQTLWKGWIRFLDMVAAIESLRNYEAKRSSPNEKISNSRFWDDWINILDIFVGKIMLWKCG